MTAEEIARRHESRAKYILSQGSDIAMDITASEFLSLLSSLREKEREAERLTALLREQNESLQSWIGMYNIAAERAATAFERAAHEAEQHGQTLGSIVATEIRKLKEGK